MAGYTRTIISGPAGSVHTNDSAKVQYQFHVAGINTCGVCWQFEGKISPSSWPIPLHYGCRCRQTAIAPGAQAQEPFVDYREEIRDLPHDQQVKVIGASSYKLLEAGKIKWTDVVTESRVRTLREVVALQRLPVKALVNAGVQPKIAEAAHAAVHTAAHEAADAQRRDLAAKLQAAGLVPDKLVAELSARIASRVSIAEGETYMTRAGQVIRGIKAQRMAVATSSAADLAKLLTAAVLVQKVAMKPKPKPKPRPKPPEQPPPIVPVKPVAPPTFEDAFEERLKSLPAGNDAPERKVRRAAIEELIKSHATAGPTGTFHGMTDPETFQTVRYSGFNFHFVDPTGLISEIENLQRRTARGDGLPTRLARATKDIYYTGQSNKDDHKWKAVYKDFPESAATGGDGTIVIYRNQTIGVGLIAHESGHSLAGELYGDADPGNRHRSDYATMLRTTKEPAVSVYATNSRAEDFAESARTYVDEPDTMKIRHPERYQIIHRLMTDPNYRG